MSRWIVPERIEKASVQEAPLRLFCFPHAGGGASLYREWIRKAPGQVYAVQLPGRENRIQEPLLYSLEEIAVQAAESLMPYTETPYAFFGHSLGARTAFETLREIRRRGGQMPVHFFVSGSPPPEYREPRPLHSLDDESFVQELKRFRGGTPEELLQNRELMAFFLPLLRADFTVDETYECKPEPPLALPITAFCGESDTEATPGQMRAWQAHTSAAFALHTLPGGHFFLTETNNRLLDRLMGSLNVQPHFK